MHIFHISTSTQLDGTVKVELDQAIDTKGNVIADVKDVEILQCSPDYLPFSGNNQVRISIGQLKDGRRYFVYRFVLFWDGFTVGSTSMEGIYCVSLNLPAKYRSTISSVRVLSLVPKNVPS